MKLILVLGLLLTSFSAYSSTCSQLVEKGTRAYTMGLSQNSRAFNSHEEAKIEQRRRSSNKEVICSHLTMARDSFAKAVRKFEKCSRIFDRAIHLCYGQRSDRARNNTRACAQRAHTAINNREIESRNMMKFCEATNEIELVIEDLQL